MRRFVVSLVLLLSLGTAAACSEDGGSATPGASDPPPLSQVSPATTGAAPANTRTPGPPVTAACKLLTSAEVASAVAMNPAPSTSEEKVSDAARSCRYQSGKRYVQLFVATEPASGTAKAAADRVVQRYQATLEEVPGLGDAAYYTGDATVQTVVAVRMEGTQVRTITLIGFLGEVYKNELIALVRTALERS